MKILCKLGLHSWYSDGAMFTSALRCSRCSKWKNNDLSVERERAAWAKVTEAVPDASTDEQSALVLRELHRQSP